ncbi:unnamed protein product [Malus baccata var. baccata]
MDSSSKDDPMYDVFLSSGGEDTRTTFTDHLYCTLEDHRFNVFMYGDEYDYKLEKSNRAIPEHLIQKIERSKVAVVVFSRGYPESAWCLEELVKIMECRKTLGQMVFPIFYGVDSSDVLNQSGIFAQAFQKYEQEVKEERVLLWRNALKEAGSLAGFNFRHTDVVGTKSAGNEGNFIRNVGWTSCGHGDIFLSGIYDIPEWFQIVGIHEPNDVRFKVPRNFRGLTVCCVFETYCPGFTVTNITKRKALHTWDESTCWVADSVLRLQSVLSNDVLHLQSGDEVSISAVTKAHGRGRVIGRVMKTGVNLVWDDGNAGDKYTSIEEIGAVPRNNSSEETLPSPSVHTDGCLPMASDLEKCANEAFIDDCFKLAVDLYTHAIAFNPQSAELYTNRAQANIKSGNLTEAVADANKAIEFDPLSYKAYLRKGIACIKLKEYQTAKATLEIGAPLAPHETRFANLIKECDEKIAEETAVLPTASLENITENVIPAKDVQPASQPSNQVTVASVKPKYRPEFYQKPEEVVVTIFAEGIPAKDVNVDFGEQKLGVSIDVAGEDTYYFQTHLFGKIIPEMCRFDVLSTKVEIRLAKAEPLHWTSLEFSEDNPVPLKVTGPVVGVPSPSYLSSKPRTNPVTVHPMPSNDANQPDGNTIVKAEPRSFIASGFSLSEEQHDVAGPPVKHRKQHRIKYAQNQEPSLLRGVYFKNMKWHAAIKVDKKQIHLGTVGSQEEAAHLYDRAAFMCGREPNFELSEEEKQELRKFKWDEFLVMTRHAITNKKHMRRQGAESEKRSESPQLEDSDWEDDQEEVSGLSASEDAEQDMSDS